MNTVEIAMRLLNKDSNTLEKSEGDLDLKDFVNDTELRQLCEAVLDATGKFRFFNEFEEATMESVRVFSEEWLDEHAGKGE